MLDYPTLTDPELHSLYLAGDAEAGNALVLRYQALVGFCAVPFFLAGGEREDLIQEGMIGLLSAIREFDPEGGASFRSFAELCIRRRLISATRGAARRKHAPLNEGLSLEQLQADGDVLLPEAPQVRSAEELVLGSSRLEELLSDRQKMLSPLEQKVLQFYLSGLSYREIAKRAVLSEKSVDNAMQRIRKKLAQQKS